MSRGGRSCEGWTWICPGGGFVALVGESGCGKSTLAALLTGRVKGWQGQVTMGGVPLEELDETGLLRTVTCLGHNAWLCKGTLADNLRWARRMPPTNSSGTR